MARMTDIGIANIGKGILAPLLKYRFMAIFSGSITDENSKAITMQVTKVFHDFKNKTVRLEVQQPMFMSALVEAIEALIDSHNLSLTIHCMDGGNSSMSNLVLSNLKCVKHSFDLDYGSSSAASHILEFTCGSLAANHEVIKFS